MRSFNDPKDIYTIEYKLTKQPSYILTDQIIYIYIFIIFFLKKYSDKRKSIDTDMKFLNYTIVKILSLNHD